MFVDAAGHRLAFPIRTTTRAEMNPKVTMAVIDDWRRAGFDVEPEMLAAQRMNDRELRATFPSFEMIRGTNSVLSRDVKRLHSAWTPLPENRFQITGNNPRYRNADLDGSIERYLAAIPRRERMEALGQIVRHLTDQLPWMGLFYDATPTIFSIRLTGATGRGPMGTQAWNSHEWELR
jgi:hypothetical protein